MDGEIDYYSSGKYVYLSDEQNADLSYEQEFSQQIYMDDKWLVNVSSFGTRVYVKITALENAEGRIVPVNEAQVTIETHVPYLWHSHVVYYDLILLAIFDETTKGSTIYVIHPDRNNEYEVYQGPNFAYKPMGIDGDVVYLSYEDMREYRSDDESVEDGLLVIGGFNLRTGQILFQHIPRHAETYTELSQPNPSLFRTYDGTLAAVIDGFNSYNEPVVSRVVSIPDFETLLEMEGNIAKFVPSQDGVFYTAYGQLHYFATLNGGQYRINFLGSEQNTEHHSLSIKAVSDNGDSIWVESSLGYDTYIFNYKRSYARNQKSARN